MAADVFAIFVWLHVNALLGDPIAGAVRVSGADNFHLAMNGTTIRVTRHSQKSLSVDMLQANLGIDLPVGTTAKNSPIIAGITFAIAAKGAHLLLTGQWAGKVMRMQIFVRLKMRQPNGGSTCNRIAALTLLLPFDLPITVDILLFVSACSLVCERISTTFS